MPLTAPTKKPHLQKQRRSSHRFVLAALATLLLIASFFMLFTAKNTLLPLSTDAVYLRSDAPVELRVDDLLSRMTLPEKIGQMALVEKNSIKNESDIAAYGLGGLLSGAGAKPTQNDPAGWKKMVDRYQQLATGSRLGIPLLYGADAVHGHAHVPGATVFPHSIGLGAAGDPELVERIARATALELRATGINWNFAPNLDLPEDTRWGRVYEAYSSDSKVATELGAAYVRGLQGDDTTVLGTLKHFIGLGSMEWNSSFNKNFRIDQGVTVADEAKLQSIYIPPFAAGVDAGALSVMTGLNQWGKHSLVTDKYLITDVLKGQLGFQGFVVSDWYGIYEGRRSRFVATVEAVNAGMDMVMLPFDYETFVRHMTLANRLGLISDERIDDAVRRILRAKFALGLFDVPSAEVVPFTVIGSIPHRQIAREAVSRSLVLLKNEGDVLPLQPATQRIYVAGSAADNTGRQSGAWTIEWQGVDGNSVPGATSILAGIREQVSGGVDVVYDKEADFAGGASKADVGIAVVGEGSYAEGWGDREYPILDEVDRKAIERLREVSEKVVVVVVSGRPLLMESEIEAADAVVAAWLPGSEGGGVADVLFGHQAFSGKLPLPWPARSEQLPIGPDGSSSDGSAPHWQLGFGLE